MENKTKMTLSVVSNHIHLKGQALKFVEAVAAGEIDPLTVHEVEKGFDLECDLSGMSCGSVMLKNLSTLPDSVAVELDSEKVNCGDAGCTTQLLIRLQPSGMEEELQDCSVTCDGVTYTGPNACCTCQSGLEICCTSEPGPPPT